MDRPRPDMDQIRLTEWTSCGGCAAKWSAHLLSDLVADLSTDRADLGLLVGLAPSDDAAVVRLTADLALVSTTDFFPPLVDDPADFGAIAAANACSDLFAMGGDVRVALNIAAFPEELPTRVIGEILAAAAGTVAAAGGVVAGGHTIRSEEPIFGLAVQGTVHPDRIWTKAGARPGDVLVLSKPLGTGIVLAGGTDAQRAAAITSMRRLNREAAAQLSSLDGGGGPHACTDVTGYGLIGHAAEMAERGRATFRIDTQALPLLDGASAVAARGTRTGGEARNRASMRPWVRLSADVPPELAAIALDPQTSGGLLAAVSGDDGRRLADCGWTVIGDVDGSVDGGPSLELR